MRITAEKAGRKLAYAAAALGAALCLTIWGGSSLTAQAADITMTSNAKVRSQASTDSSVVGSVASGTTLTVAGETTGADGHIWYQVSVGGATGYVRSDLASKSAGNMTQAEVERENSYTETAATVSEADVSKGFVAVDSANVRKGPSSTDAPVTSVKSGTELAITGVATGADGNMWYQVEVNGKTGFVRCDLVEASEPNEGGDAPEENAEEGSGEGTEEGAETDGQESEASGETEASEEPEGTTEISNVISSRIIPGDADLENMTVDAATLAEWESGNYYVLYTKDADGGDSWYLYSLSDNQFEQISDLHGNDAEEGGDSAGLSLPTGSSRLILIIAAVLFVVLILTCILLAVKLHEYRGYEYYEDDEDDDDEDDDEDDDDEEDDDEEEDDEEDDEVRRRPVKKKHWSPKNFLARQEDEDDDDEDEDDDDEEDEEEDEDEEYLDDDDFEFEFLNMDGKDKF